MDEIVKIVGWREKGEPDPHAGQYDGDRSTLCGGHLTDDQVAYQTAMLMRHDLNHEPVLQTAKDRIRRLSRRLHKTETEVERLQEWNDKLARALARASVRMKEVATAMVALQEMRPVALPVKLEDL